MGENHTIVLSEGGSVFCWGKNEKGCLGKANLEKGSIEKDSEESILSYIEGINAGKNCGVAWSKINHFRIKKDLFLTLH